MKGPADKGEIGDGAGARYVDVVLESDDDDEAACKGFAVAPAPTARGKLARVGA